MNIFCRLLLTTVVCCSVNLSQGQVKTPVKKKIIRKTVPAPVKTTIKPASKDSLLPVKALGARVKITTSLGDIIVRLYDKTPLHRDNFLRLVSDKFYDSLVFHRVIANFMIQGGDPESRNAPPGTMLGKGDVGYTIPAEIDSTLYHKKGALAAARNNNPEKASSGCQFYIVHGKKYADAELDVIEQQKGLYFSPIKRMTYKFLGGTPNLDMNYTIFGEVESGLEVVDQVAQLPKTGFDRPLTDVYMKMEILN